MIRGFGYGRHEKLKSRKKIEKLFLEGQRFSVFPIRTTYMIVPSESAAGIQAGVTVTKKHFKKAKDRNRIKRLMREAYRLQKKELAERVQSRNVQLLVFFMYGDKELPVYQTIRLAMLKSLEKLSQAISTYEKPA